MGFQFSKNRPKQVKDSVVRFRVTKQEQRTIAKTAKRHGFNSISAYLLSIHREKKSPQSKHD